jgi:DNA-directed RNA polymerase I, II, and III subunit RPABC2
MYEDADDYDNDLSNEQEFSDDEEITDLNIEDEEKQNDEDGFKILTYKNVLENIEKKPKKTIPILTKFEKAKIMGVRLQQLAYGAKPRVDTLGLRSIQEIVEKELKERKILFIIRRNLPNGTYEDWKLEEFVSIE